MHQAGSLWEQGDMSSGLKITVIAPGSLLGPCSPPMLKSHSQLTRLSMHYSLLMDRDFPVELGLDPLQFILDISQFFLLQLTGCLE